MPQTSVLQGSHIGPLLYIIYCNDLEEYTNDKSILVSMYADDMKIMRKIKGADDQEKLQQAINNVQRWTVSNKLSINVDKTFHITHSRTQKNIKRTYFANGRKITYKPVVRDLGILVDEHITFNPHINHISLVGRQIIGAAYKLVRELNHPQLMYRIYNVYVQPIFEYGSVIWDQQSTLKNKQIDDIFRRVSKVATLLPHSVIYPNYKSYELRCTMLNAVTPRKVFGRQQEPVITLANNSS